MMTIIAVLNILFNAMFPFYVYIIATIVFTILVIIVDAIVATIIRKLPEKGFDYHKKIFLDEYEKISSIKSLECLRIFERIKSKIQRIQNI